MDDQDKGNQEKKESDTRRSPAYITEPIDSQAAQPATAKQLEDVEKQTSGFEKATLRWAKIAVGMSFLAAVFVCAQWYEMHTGSRDTHALAQAADTQAKKMTTMSDAAEKIRQAAEGMVSQEQRMADNSKQSLAASNRQSKAVLDATIAASRLDQRAWIGIGLFQIIQFEKDKPFKVDIEIKNSGKTPALHMMESVKYFQDFRNRPEPADEWFTAIMQPAEAIPPQGSHTIHVEIAKDIMAPIFDEIKAKTRLMYIIGTLDYKTISNETGFTEFCLVLVDPEKPMLGFCGTHNNMK